MYLRPWERGAAKVRVQIKGRGPAGLAVPPDVTLLRSGADPAAEVGRLTAALLWVEEDHRGSFGLGGGMGWHPGYTLNADRAGLVC